MTRRQPLFPRETLHGYHRGEVGWRIHSHKKPEQEGVEGMLNALVSDRATIEMVFKADSALMAPGISYTLSLEDATGSEPVRIFAKRIHTQSRQCVEDRCFGVIGEQSAARAFKQIFALIIRWHVKDFGPGPHAAPDVRATWDAAHLDEAAPTVEQRKKLPRM